MKDLPSFRPFNPQGQARVFYRYFPHRRQEGCTYFVTFRLANSIPRETVAQWAEEDRLWLQAHGVHGPLKDPLWREKYAQIQAGERHRYEDGRARRLHLELEHCRVPGLLERWDARSLLENCLRQFDGQHLRSGDYVILPNRVHWILMPLAGFELEDLLHTVKDTASTEFSERFAFGGKLWQRENYDRIIRRRLELDCLRKYISEIGRRSRLFPGQFTYRRGAWLDR